MEQEIEHLEEEIDRLETKIDDLEGELEIAWDDHVTYEEARRDVEADLDDRRNLEGVFTQACLALVSWQDTLNPEDGKEAGRFFENPVRDALRKLGLYNGPLHQQMVEL